VSAESGRIEPRLGTFDAAMLVVSLVIGIGIFRTPAIVAGAAESGTLFLVAWLLGGAVSLMGAFTYAEIGSRFPRAGGYYKVVADCYHPAFAFMLNWAQAIMQGAGAAGVAFIGAEYLGLLILPADRRTPGSTLLLATALMVVLLVLNYLGIRAGARTQNVLSMAKIVMILGLGAAALLLAEPAAARPLPATGNLWTRLVSAAVPVFYAYGGYQCAMNMAGDVREARRRLPLAITLGMAVVVSLYLLVNLAYVHVLGAAGVAESDLVAAAVARAAFGPAGERVVSLAIFLSAAGFVNAVTLHMPRSYYAMAQDGALPAVFLRITPRTQTQEAGLAFFGATMLIPALVLGSFEKLLNYVMFSDSLTLVTVASTIFVLRRRQAGEGAGGGAFRAPLYPLPPVVFMLCLFGVALRILVVETPLALGSIAIFLAGWPLFLLARRVSR